MLQEGWRIAVLQNILTPPKRRNWNFLGVGGDLQDQKILRGEKLNYKSVAKEVSKPLFFWLLKSSGHQSLLCLFDSRFL